MTDADLLKLGREYCGDCGCQPALGVKDYFTNDDAGTARRCVFCGSFVGLDVDGDMKVALAILGNVLWRALKERLETET